MKTDSVPPDQQVLDISLVQQLLEFFEVFG